MCPDNMKQTAILSDKLDIAIERVEKLSDPLLVIGLGGTGADIVHTIKRTFAERYVLPRDKDGNQIPIPRRTDYLVMDSASDKLSEFDDWEKKDITVPGLSAILDPQTRNANLKPYELKWVHPGLNAVSAGKGAGTYRQAARLMLSRHYNEIRSLISAKLNRLVSVVAGGGEGDVGRINVVIAAGLCGGTGSGTFLDVAQIVRACLSDGDLSGRLAKITGYLVLPDVACSNIKDDDDGALKDILKANGFAALKELDFWMRVDEHKTPYTVQYSDGNYGEIRWDKPPFDACVLMSGISVNGDAYNEGYTVMQNTIAENLLHYLAYEKTEDGKVQHTYMDYEDNLQRITNGTVRSRPLFYGYRAVGAYTKRIPKRDVMFYEGLKLLNVFVPPRDPNGNLVPDDTLLRDGQNMLRANTITGVVNDLLRNVSARVALPGLVSMPVDTLQTMNPKPHDRPNYKTATAPSWESDALPPAMAAYAEKYLDSAWEKFVEFATTVIEDPARGPFALRAYLDSEKESGLLKALGSTLTDWTTKQINLESKRSTMLEICERVYPTFLKPPFVGKQKAIDAYLDALRSYFNHIRAIAFMDAFVPALKKLILRINEYMETVLANMCDDLEKYQKLFGTSASLLDMRLESNIYSLDDVKPQIDKVYEVNDTDFKFERLLLGTLCEESFKTEANVDPHSSGVYFTYRHKHLDILYDELRKVLNDCFGSSNGQTLDTIMEQMVGHDVADQNAYMDNLIKSVMDSSLPLFAQNGKYKDEQKAAFSYLSIPDDATRFIERYHETLTNKCEPKPSSIRDHVYCMTTWDALPLYRYSQMEDIEAVYNKELSNEKVRMGLHLVHITSPGCSFQSNWELLPSPRPFYLFGTNADNREESQYKALRDTIHRGIACGMVVVDDTVAKPSITLRLQYANIAHTAFKVAQTMLGEIDVILAQKDAITQKPISSAVQASLLNDYLDGAQTIVLEPNVYPAVMAPLLGMAENPAANDPWDDATRANPLLHQQAMKNFRKLSEELAVAVIARYPMYVQGIELQLAAVEHAKAIINGIAQEKKVWEPRIAYAPIFAKLYIHSIVSPGMDGYQYVHHSGTKVSLLEAQLLKQDLVNEKPILKNAAYLADLDERHEVRTDLEELLGMAESSLKDKRMDGTLSKDTLENLMKRIAFFIEKCEKDRAAYSIAKHGVSDKERYEKIDMLYKQMIATAKGLDDTYQEVLGDM